MCNNACRIFKEAWQKVSGMKSAVWGAIVLMMLIGVAGYAILGIILAAGQVIYSPTLIQTMHDDAWFFLKPGVTAASGLIALIILYNIGQFVFEFFVMLPIRMGMFLIPLRHVAGKSISACYIFRFFKWRYIWRFILLQVLLMIMIGVPAGVGAVLFYVPAALGMGIALKLACYVVGVALFLLALYLSIVYLFSPLCIIDRDLSAWQAMKKSRESVRNRWFCVFGALLWAWFSIVIGAACLIVGLVWAIPYAQNIYVILYRELCGGIESRDPVSVGCQKTE